MNIGQVLEVHLGYAAKTLGWKVATPIFDGATDKDISEALQLAGITDDSGIALQFFSELIECMKAFLCLADKRHVADKVFITQWIIHV